MGYIVELREQMCMPMLITALRDMQWRLRRFIIAAIGTGMVFALTLIITGLTHGFRVEAQRVVDSLGIDTYLIQSGAVGPFMGSSRFPEAETQAIARLPGVESAIPVIYGNIILQDRRSPENVNVYGVPEHGLGMPPIAAGRAPSNPGEVAMSTTLGRSIGDDVEMGRRYAADRRAGRQVDHARRPTQCVSDRCGGAAVDVFRAAGDFRHRFARHTHANTRRLSRRGSPRCGR